MGRKSFGDWWSYNSAGSPLNVIDWGDGIDNEGFGVYPLARFSPSPHQSESFYTDGAATSDVMPYIQLLTCVKK